MQGAPLYSVKWYRGNHEFFRYTPTEKPITMGFPLPGINVDINRSNGTQVFLKNMFLEGNFSCEVTADSPSFATQIAARFIEVVILPPVGPILTTAKDRYQPGEVLRANCTSSTSRPPANLTIYINEEPLRASETRLQPVEMRDIRGLVSPSVNVELKVTPDLFPGGRLRVTCIASIYDVYNESARLDFLTPDSGPRPERITLNGSVRRFQSWILLFLLLLLPMAIQSQDYEFFNEEVFYDPPVYYDEPTESKVAISLLGA